jgi:hypothetical protein
MDSSEMTMMKNNWSINYNNDLEKKINLGFYI